VTIGRQSWPAYLVLRPSLAGQLTVERAVGSCTDALRERLVILSGSLLLVVEEYKLFESSRRQVDLTREAAPRIWRRSSTRQ